MAEVSAAGRALSAAASRYGLTQRQLGAALGVSDRMVRAVMRGEKPGRNLEAAARQLAESGRISKAPARREQRVRTPGGGVSAEPVRAVDVRFAAEGDGRAQTTVGAPSRGLGREAARRAILNDLEARRGGRRDRHGARVMFKVTDKRGRTFTLGAKGGYDPRAAAARMRGEGDDPLGWLADEIADGGAYADGGTPTAGAIVSVSLIYF